MADNRMYLLHRPTGLAVYLGKRYNGWFDVPERVSDNIQALFDAVDDEPAIDDFAIAMETKRGEAPLVVTGWKMESKEWVHQLTGIVTPDAAKEAAELRQENQRLRDKIGALEKYIEQRSL